MKQQEPLDHRSGQATLLGDLLKQQREAAGLSLHQAGVELAVSRPHLSKLERGVCAHPSPLILMAAAKMYGTRLADLYAAAGYLSPSELPSFATYVHTTCRDLPDAAVCELTDFYEFLKQRNAPK